MLTFWVRLYCDKDIEFSIIDAFNTEEIEESKVICFAVRAEDKYEVFDFLDEFLCGGSFQVDFIEEKPWKTYRDFCGNNSRFKIAEKYLDNEIDTVEVCLRRL